MEMLKKQMELMVMFLLQTEMSKPKKKKLTHLKRKKKNLKSLRKKKPMNQQVNKNTNKPF